MDLERENTSLPVNSVISTHAWSCTQSHRIETSLAGLQMGTQSISRQLLFILLVKTVPEAEMERVETEKGWRKGKLIH